jgi:putative transposase
MNTTTHQRRAIVDKANAQLSISRQCKLLTIARSGLYYEPVPESEENLKLMELIDKEYTKRPFKGVPSMTTWLREDMGLKVNHKRVERLYRIMDLYALVPGPHTSKGNKTHKKYPYLLRGLKIDRPNQVWGIDITYVPVRGGFMYLIAIIDLYSRYIVGWSLSNTMDTNWCIEALKEAFTRHGKPEIINTDQGSQFTSEDFTNFVLESDVKMSMDGVGRATDNIFIERFWRSIKYEDIYLYSYENGQELFMGIKRYMEYYNHQRRHSSIADNRPGDIYLMAA